jgi:hypothetical protein
MSSQVRVVKKPKDEASTRVDANGERKNERQRNREMVGVIKSWVEEFKLRTVMRSEAALALLNK